MSVENTWKSARSPNYDKNKDKLYPYSELPYQGAYKLVKIPLYANNYIDHVDYFGEGVIETISGTKGFYDCYNVNDQYNLVAEEPDKGRRIPNRVPIDPNHDHTRYYIKDNSVLTVTCCEVLSVETFTEDIVRVVNSDWGKVILYGYDINNTKDNALIEIISEELKKSKQLFYSPIYLLPEHLQLTYYKTCYRAYLSLNELKCELYNHVNKGDYEAAVILTECLSNVYCCTAVGDVVNKLLENRDTHVMVYAYKLWNNNAKDIICKHFPAAFKLIFNGDCMMIINKQYNQALKLCGDEYPSTKQAWGDNHYGTSNIISWKIIPIWENDNISFKIYNVDSDMYLELDRKGDTEVWSSNNSENILLYNFNLEPLLVNGEVAFTIINCKFGQQLRLAEKIDAEGDRNVFGQAVVAKDNESFMWILAPFKKSVGNNKFMQCPQEFVNIHKKSHSDDRDQ